MKTVLLFGATGTIGAYACLYLKEAGYEVIASARRKDDNGFFAEHGIRYIPADITQSLRNTDFPKEIDCIVNLSGMLPARMKGYAPREYIDTNLIGSFHILELAAGMGGCRIISTQSIADVAYLCGSSKPIAADSESRFPEDNDHSVYSIMKTAACNLVRHYAVKYNFKYYLLRLPNIYLYSPNPKYFVDGEERWQGYRLMIHKAMHGEPLQIYGNPGIVRDIVYVKDCCQMIERCVATETAPSGMYNVGTGIGTTIENQVRGIAEVFSPGGKPVPVTYAPEKPDTPCYVFDISKSVRELGYQPMYDYLGYLKDFKEEMQKQTFKKLWGEDRYL